VHKPLVPFLPLLPLSIALCLCAVSCAPRHAELQLPDGALVHWSPEQPRIGDLVAVIYRSGTSGISPEILSPGGKTIAASILDHERSGTGSRLYFRITESGDWILVPDGTSGRNEIVLFTVASEAGDRTEPLTLDAQKLYTGTGEAAQ